MKPCIVSFFILSLCQLGVAQISTTSSALKYCQKGEAAENKKQAFFYFEKAIIQAKKEEDWSTYIRTLKKLMSIVPTLDENQTHQVFSWMKESIRLKKKNINPLDLADLHFNCATFYRNKSAEKDSALYHYNTARILRSKVVGEWHESVAACYHGVADIYKYYKYEFADAEVNYEKALEIRERISATDLNVLAKNYYGLAATNRSQEDFQKAISYGSKTIELVEKTNNLQLLEESYTIVANIYRDMGQTSTAKNYYYKAIALNLKTKNSSENLAWHYLNLAVTLKKDSLYNEAIDIFSRAVSIYNSIEGKDKELFIYCLGQMAETYLFNNDYKSSIKIYTQLLKSLKVQGKLKGRQLAEAFTGLGNYYMETHQNDSALFYYQKALTSAVPFFDSVSDDNPSPDLIGINFYIYRILVKKAALLKILSKTHPNSSFLKKSLECLILSEELLVKEKSTLDMEDSKWKFLDANYNVYEQIISTVCDMQRMSPNDSLLALAFRYFEKSKSSSLAEALFEAERNGSMKMSDSLFRHQNNLKRTIFKVQDELNKVLGGSNPNSKEVARLRGEVVKLDRRIQLNKSAIEHKYPGYFKVKYAAAIPSLEDVKQYLAKKDQVLLEYCFGNESVYGLCISKDSVSFKRLGSADSSGAVIQAFRNHFNGKVSSFNAEVFKAFVSNSHFLYGSLIEPFVSLHETTKRILVIPDGPLGQLPFETLVEEMPVSSDVNYLSLKYLLKKYTIGYAYSSVSLFNADQHSTSSPSVLAMAFSGKERTENMGFQTILGVERELQMLEDKLTTGEFLNSEQASELNFKKLSPWHDIIHLAVHGQGDLQKGNASSLYFTAKNDSVEDSELHAYELYGLKLKARLVVLSACETGLGTAYKGEGMLSMASAFTFSGCQNILMSLWKINDKVSVSLIDNFYDELLKGNCIDEAIAQAKREYLNQADELTADPGNWAPLVAYGNLEPVFTDNKNRTIAMILISIIAALFLFYILKYKLKVN